MIADDLEHLEQKIHYRFNHRERLIEALTHSTYANEHPGLHVDYERLEFLGDAVLDLLAAEYLYEMQPEDGEGEMSRRRARVVRRDSLAQLATELGLASYLRLGVGQTRSGQTSSILADVYEAVVGAVFIDGGYDAVRTSFGPTLLRALEDAKTRIDFKTILQELCHRLHLPPPEYNVVSVEGPDHESNFVSEVKVGDEVLSTNRARSKKRSEQACAQNAIDILNTRDATP